MHAVRQSSRPHASQTPSNALTLSTYSTIFPFEFRVVGEQTIHLGQDSSKDYYSQNYHQNQQQTAHLIPRILLVPTRRC